MVKRIISKREKISQIDYFQGIADEAAKSKDFSKKIGACTIYAGLIDFTAIQSVKLLEQILIKSEIHRGKKPSFKPHDDSFFYTQRIDTRRLVKEIRKFLPFKATGGARNEDAEVVNKLAFEFIDSINLFLDYRNDLMHQLGSPNKDTEDINTLCDKIIEQYKICLLSVNHFVIAAIPFKLNEQEYNKIYGN